MSVKSKKSSQRKVRKGPFATGVVAKARRITEQYQIVLSEEEGHWYGRGLEMPSVFGDGATPSACLKSTRDALIGATAFLLEEGQRPPAPAREGARSEQVNVRLTADEKAILESTARRKGFKGLSDFIRAAALQDAG
jgi:predicted RNase H-like HicB family nuclease